MGLGRDEWSVATFERIFRALLAQMPTKTVILDADALWHLADYPLMDKLPHNWILTPHSSEAGRLLDISADTIENDRFNAIKSLQQKYGGQWVLKGANTLTLDNREQLEICMLGNAGMATAGMGDVLSGMLTGLYAQFRDGDTISPMTAVALHAHAGDLLAKGGMRGMSAHEMMSVIRQAVNLR